LSTSKPLNLLHKPSPSRATDIQRAIAAGEVGVLPEIERGVKVDLATQPGAEHSRGFGRFHKWANSLNGNRVEVAADALAGTVTVAAGSAIRRVPTAFVQT